ncbi:MAG: hypothetical protein IH965_07255 [Gemmatimonadetes bacterium]|nr:hypothetical protein [Gemmatimonadota bacterium]
MTAATVMATVMIAFQMAAKATRNALFLSSFDVSMLPRMVVGAAVVSVLLVFVATRALTRVGPGRLVPIAFASSAVLLLVEWFFVASFRGPVSVLVYIHFSGLGAVLISGFWSIINERFDPRTAKKAIGRIAAGGTVGGLLGGLLAERAAVLLPSVTSMLPILAGLHFACAWLVLGVVSGASSGRGTRAPDAQGLGSSGVTLIRKTGYLRALVALVLLTTVSEGLVDYLFKAQAFATFGGGEQLLRLFAVFYTGVALLTVLVQAVASRFSLERLGLGRTVALLPSAVAVGGAVALFVPVFGMILSLRGVESVARNGLYRAGYELLFAPLAPRQKRSTKMLVDVGAVRLGDVVGAAIVQITIIAAVAHRPVLLGIAIAFSIAGAIVAIGLQRGYVKALERSLLSRAGQLDLAEARDLATRTAMLQSAGALGLTLFDPTESLQVERVDSAAEAARARPAPAPSIPRLDAELDRLAELRSREPPRVRHALATPLTEPLVGYVVPLLAWDEVAADAVAALRQIAPRATGQLVDHLLDPDESFAVRRRIPLVLAACPTQRAVDGLTAGLEDPRFEVRYRCGRALNRLVDLNPDLVVDRERAQAAALREVAVDRGVWQSQRLIDQMDDEAWSPMMDEVLRDRADRSLEHVFTVLALFLPRRPLKVAFRGLHTNDKHLRGTALEYLDSALPDDIRKALWPFVEDVGRKSAERRSANQVLADLLESSASIVINLEALRKKRESGAD